MPSAAGLVFVSACERYGVMGVPCEKNLFATGMNGDEDLGQDIIMKGDKFHYNQKLAQWVPVVVASTGTLPECHGNNGPDGVNCTRAVCHGTNGPLDGPSGTPCTREEPAAIPHYNTDPVAGRPYQTSGDITRTHPADPAPEAAAKIQLSADPAPADSAKDAAPKASTVGYPAPEKVLTLDPKIARTHTTFYGQRK